MIEYGVFDWFGIFVRMSIGFVLFFVIAIPIKLIIFSLGISMLLKWRKKWTARKLKKEEGKNIGAAYGPFNN